MLTVRALPMAKHLLAEEVTNRTLVREGSGRHEVTERPVVRAEQRVVREGRSPAVLR
jgi:hypothetical protein